MTKEENDNAEVSEPTEAEEESPLQQLSRLIEDHHALLAFSADSPIGLAHPAMGFVREAVRLGMLVLEEDADFLRRVMAQFDAPVDGSTS